MGFDEIDALLEASEPVEDGMPEPAERARLRACWKLTQQQVAGVVGVSRETVGAWEAGRREPSGACRARYLYLLRGIQEREERRTAPAPESLLAEEPSAVVPVVGEVVGARACVLCGGPAMDEVEGFPQHLDSAECAPASGARVAPGPATSLSEGAAAPAPVFVDEAEVETASAAVSEGGDATMRPCQGAYVAGRLGPVARGRAKRGSLSSHGAGAGAVLLEHLTSRVEEALAQHEGDTDAATAGLVHKAIPDVMTLLDLSRAGGRYDFTMHPPLPDLLRKKSAHGSDEVWEARPKWALSPAFLPMGECEVTALDMNAAYLSAFKAHLPIGALEHQVGVGASGLVHDRRRSGIYLITPPAWEHSDVPHPLGGREEPGRLWVAEPTLRLLQSLASAQHRLCEPPVIHESWTSGSSEGLLEKLRAALTEARAAAIEVGDTVTEEYVKAMYSKFVSTMGESTYNRELNRPDWMHIIRAQAFTNLWRKALKARESGLHVVRALGTDELHVTGPWRQAFSEGRGVTEVKVKDTYTVTGTGSADA